MASKKITTSWNETAEVYEHGAFVELRVETCERGKPAMTLTPSEAAQLGNALLAFATIMEPQEHE